MTRDAGVETRNRAPVLGEGIVRPPRIDEDGDAGGNDRRTEVIWAAGFFDGEGTVSLAHNKKRRSGQLRISVTQVDPVPLRIFLRLFSGYIYRSDAAAGKGPNGTWRDR